MKKKVHQSQLNQNDNASIKFQNEILQAKESLLIEGLNKDNLSHNILNTIVGGLDDNLTSDPTKQLDGADQIDAPDADTNPDASPDETSTVLEPDSFSNETTDGDLTQDINSESIDATISDGQDGLSMLFGDPNQDSAIILTPQSISWGKGNEIDLGSEWTSTTNGDGSMMTIVDGPNTYQLFSTGELDVTNKVDDGQQIHLHFNPNGESFKETVDQDGNLITYLSLTNTFLVDSNAKVTNTPDGFLKIDLTPDDVSNGINTVNIVLNANPNGLILERGLDRLFLPNELNDGTPTFYDHTNDTLALQIPERHQSLIIKHGISLTFSYNDTGNFFTSDPGGYPLSTNSFSLDTKGVDPTTGFEILERTDFSLDSQFRVFEDGSTLINDNGVLTVIDAQGNVSNSTFGESNPQTILFNFSDPSSPLDKSIVAIPNSGTNAELGVEIDDWSSVQVDDHGVTFEGPEKVVRITLDGTIREAWGITNMDDWINGEDGSARTEVIITADGQASLQSTDLDDPIQLGVATLNVDNDITALDINNEQGDFQVHIQADGSVDRQNMLVNHTFGDPDSENAIHLTYGLAGQATLSWGDNNRVNLSSTSTSEIQEDGSMTILDGSIIINLRNDGTMEETFDDGKRDGLRFLINPNGDSYREKEGEDGTITRSLINLDLFGPNAIFTNAHDGSLAIDITKHTDPFLGFIKATVTIELGTSPDHFMVEDSNGSLIVPDNARMFYDSSNDSIRMESDDQTLFINRDNTISLHFNNPNSFTTTGLTLNEGIENITLSGFADSTLNKRYPVGTRFSTLEDGSIIVDTGDNVTLIDPSGNHVSNSFFGPFDASTKLISLSNNPITLALVQNDNQFIIGNEFKHFIHDDGSITFAGQDTVIDVDTNGDIHQYFDVPDINALLQAIENGEDIQNLVETFLTITANGQASLQSSDLDEPIQLGNAHVNMDDGVTILDISNEQGDFQVHIQANGSVNLQHSFLNQEFGDPDSESTIALTYGLDAQISLSWDGGQQQIQLPKGYRAQTDEDGSVTFLNFNFKTDEDGSVIEVQDPNTYLVTSGGQLVWTSVKGQSVHFGPNGENFKEIKDEDGNVIQHTSLDNLIQDPNANYSVAVDGSLNIEISRQSDSSSDATTNFFIELGSKSNPDALIVKDNNWNSFAIPNTARLFDTSDGELTFSSNAYTLHLFNDGTFNIQFSANFNTSSAGLNLTEESDGTLTLSLNDEDGTLVKTFPEGSRVSHFDDGSVIVSNGEKVTIIDSKSHVSSMFFGSDEDTSTKLIDITGIDLTNNNLTGNDLNVNQNTFFDPILALVAKNGDSTNLVQIDSQFHPQIDSDGLVTFVKQTDETGHFEVIHVDANGDIHHGWGVTNVNTWVQAINNGDDVGDLEQTHLTITQDDQAIFQRNSLRRQGDTILKSQGNGSISVEISDQIGDHTMIIHRDGTTDISTDLNNEFFGAPTSPGAIKISYALGGQVTLSGGGDDQIDLVLSPDQFTRERQDDGSVIFANGQTTYHVKGNGQTAVLDVTFNGNIKAHYDPTGDSYVELWVPNGETERTHLDSNAVYSTSSDGSLIIDESGPDGESVQIQLSTQVLNRDKILTTLSQTTSTNDVTITTGTTFFDIAGQDRFMLPIGSITFAKTPAVFFIDDNNKWTDGHGLSISGDAELHIKENGNIQFTVNNNGITSIYEFRSNGAFVSGVTIDNAGVQTDISTPPLSEFIPAGADKDALAEAVITYGVDDLPDWALDSEGLVANLTSSFVSANEKNLRDAIAKQLIIKIAAQIIQSDSVDVNLALFQFIENRFVTLVSGGFPDQTIAHAEKVAGTDVAGALANGDDQFDGVESEGTVERILQDLNLGININESLDTKVQLEVLDGVIQILQNVQDQKSNSEELNNLQSEDVRNRQIEHESLLNQITPKQLDELNKSIINGNEQPEWVNEILPQLNVQQLDKLKTSMLSLLNMSDTDSQSKQISGFIDKLKQNQNDVMNQLSEMILDQITSMDDSDPLTAMQEFISESFDDQDNPINTFDQVQLLHLTNSIIESSTEQQSQVDILFQNILSDNPELQNLTKVSQLFDTQLQLLASVEEQNSEGLTQYQQSLLHDEFKNFFHITDPKQDGSEDNDDKNQGLSKGEKIGLYIGLGVALLFGIGEIIDPALAGIIAGTELTATELGIDISAFIDVAQIGNFVDKAKTFSNAAKLVIGFGDIGLESSIDIDLLDQGQDLAKLQKTIGANAENSETFLLNTITGKDANVTKFKNEVGLTTKYLANVERLKGLPQGTLTDPYLENLGLKGAEFTDDDGTITRVMLGVEVSGDPNLSFGAGNDAGGDGLGQPLLDGEAKGDDQPPVSNTIKLELGLRNGIFTEQEFIDFLNEIEDDFKFNLDDFAKLRAELENSEFVNVNNTLNNIVFSEFNPSQETINELKVSDKANGDKVLDLFFEQNHIRAGLVNGDFTQDDIINLIKNHPEQLSPKQQFNLFNNPDYQKLFPPRVQEAIKENSISDAQSKAAFERMSVLDQARAIVNGFAEVPKEGDPLYNFANQFINADDALALDNYILKLSEQLPTNQNKILSESLETSVLAEKNAALLADADDAEAEVEFRNVVGGDAVNAEVNENNSLWNRATLIKVAGGLSAIAVTGTLATVLPLVVFKKDDNNDETNPDPEPGEPGGPPIPGLLDQLIVISNSLQENVGNVDDLMSLQLSGEQSGLQITSKDQAIVVANLLLSDDSVATDMGNPDATTLANGIMTVANMTNDLSNQYIIFKSSSEQMQETIKEAVREKLYAVLPDNTDALTTDDQVTIAAVLSASGETFDEFMEGATAPSSADSNDFSNAIRLLQVGNSSDFSDQLQAFNDASEVDKALMVLHAQQILSLSDAELAVTPDSTLMQAQIALVGQNLSGDPEPITDSKPLIDHIQDRIATDDEFAGQVRAMELVDNIIVAENLDITGNFGLAQEMKDAFSFELAHNKGIDGYSDSELAAIAAAVNVFGANVETGVAVTTDNFANSTSIEAEQILTPEAAFEFAVNVNIDGGNQDAIDQINSLINDFPDSINNQAQNAMLNNQSISASTAWTPNVGGRSLGSLAAKYIVDHDLDAGSVLATLNALNNDEIQREDSRNMMNDIEQTIQQKLATNDFFAMDVARRESLYSTISALPNTIGDNPQQLENNMIAAISHQLSTFHSIDDFNALTDQQQAAIAAAISAWDIKVDFNTKPQNPDDFDTVVSMGNGLRDQAVIDKVKSTLDTDSASTINNLAQIASNVLSDLSAVRLEFFNGDGSFNDFGLLFLSFIESEASLEGLDSESLFEQENSDSTFNEAI